MPNAILRAGPFAGTSGSFVNEPVSASNSTLPVNCAGNAWVSDNWKSYVKTRGSISTGTGTTIVENYQNGPTLEVEVSSNGVVQNPSGTEPEESFVEFRFSYQAAVSFTVRFTATVTRLSTTSSGDQSVSSQFIANGVNVSIADTEGTPTTVTKDITLSASVVPTSVTASIESFSIEGVRSKSLLKVEPL